MTWIKFLPPADGRPQALLNCPKGLPSVQKQTIRETCSWFENEDSSTIYSLLLLKGSVTFLRWVILNLSEPTYSGRLSRHSSGVTVCTCKENGNYFFFLLLSKCWDWQVKTEEREWEQRALFLYSSKSNKNSSQGGRLGCVFCMVGPLHIL